MRPASRRNASTRPNRFRRLTLATAGLLIAAVSVGGFPPIVAAAEAPAEAKPQSEISKSAPERESEAHKDEPTESSLKKPPNGLPPKRDKDDPRGFVDGRSVEDVSKRTATSQTWKNPDNSFTTRITPNERFFEKGQAFEPIDNTLVADDATATFRNKANSFVARFGPNSVVSLETPEGTITMVPQADTLREPKIDLKRETATYENVWPGVDVRYRPVNHGLKEEIVLREVPSTSEFSFRIQGTTLSPRPDGGLSTGGAFAQKWEISPPVVFDKHGAEIPAADARFRVTGDLVTLTVSDRWRKTLRAADLPLVLDPTLVHRGAGSWAFRSNGTGCQLNEYGNCQIQVGGSESWRSTGHFAYNNLPGPITDVKIVFNQQQEPVTQDNDIHVYGAGQFGTWDWPTLGPDLGHGPTSTTQPNSHDFEFRSPELTNYYKNLVAQQNWNQSLKFVAADNVPGSYMRWFYFELEFTTNHAPSPAYPATPPSPDNGSVIESVQPRLGARATDGDGDQIWYWYTLCTNPNMQTGCQHSNQWITASETNPDASWQVPTPLARGTTYYWHAKSTSVSNWDPQEWAYGEPNYQPWSFTPATGTVMIEKAADRTFYNRGDVINYTITLTNPTAITVDQVELWDYLPQDVQIIPASLAAGCPGCVIWNPQFIRAITQAPAHSSKIFTIQAFAVGSERGCSVATNVAKAYIPGKPLVWDDAPVTICGGGLGIEPWWTYVDETLGPQGTARVNVANGNLVVQQTDSAPVPAHGRLGYVLRRTYNSQDPGNLSLGPNSWGKGWMLNVGEAEDGAGLGQATRLVIPQPTGLLADVAKPAHLIYVDRDGTRHVFTPQTIYPYAEVTSASVASLAALVPKVLSVTSARICASQTYYPPPGVHVALWRYVAISSNSTCSTFDPTQGVVLGYAAMRPDRVRYEFAADGRLLSMTDAAGVELRYVYDGMTSGGLVPPLTPPNLPVQLGQLRTIYEPRSCSDPSVSTCRAFRFQYSEDAGGLCPAELAGWKARCITDPAGRKTKYHLDNNDLLVKVDNVSDNTSVSYTYGQCGTQAGTRQNNLCEIRDPRGSVSRFGYEPGAALGWPDRLKTIDGRLAGNGDLIDITYISPTEVRADQGNERRRYIIESNSATTEPTAGRVVTLEEGGKSTTDEVSPLLRKTTFTWELSSSDCNYAYTDRNDNNLCRLTRAGALNGFSSPDEDISWTYTAEGEKVRESRATANGQVTTTWGHRVQYGRADGTTECLDYRTTGNGSVTVGSPSCNGSFAGPTTALYAITDNTEVLTPRGNRPVSDPNPGTCDETYGAADNGTADPDCYRTTYLRDIPAPTGTDRVSSVSPTKAPTSSPCGGVVGNTGLLCESRQPAFGSSGTPTTTRYTYDVFGQRTTMTSPKAIAEGQSSSSYRYTYYEDSELSLSTDPQLRVSAGGWLKAVTDPTGAFVAFGYDRAGNAVRTWDRNATKDLTISAFPAGAGATRPFAEKRYSLDADAYGRPGRYLVSESDPLGNKTSYELDNNGNRTAITPPRGNAGGGSAHDIVQTFGLSDLLLTRALPGEPVTANEYDAFQNLVTVTDPVGNKTVHRYDQVNRRTETRWHRGPNTGVIGTGCRAWTSGDAPIPSGTVVCTTSQRYDGVDRVIESTDARGGKTLSSYDALGREISRKTQRSATDWVRTDTVYDLDGNVIGVCLPRHFTPSGTGTCSDGAGDVHRENRAYDQAGRLVRATKYRDGGGVRIPLTATYSYDADGNSVRRDDPQDSGDPNDDRTTTFTFDLLGRKKSERVARAAGLAPETQWNYDPVGNVTSVVRPGTAPAERVTAYRYDNAHRLTLTVEGSDNLDAASAGLPDNDGGKNVRTGVVYDPDGNVIARFEPRAYVPYPNVPDPRNNPNPAFMVRTDYDVDGRPVGQWVPRYGSGVTDLSADTNQKAECPEIDKATFPNHVPKGAPEYPNGVGVCLSRAEYDDASRVVKVILPNAGWNRSATGPSTPSNTNRHLTYTYTGDNLIATETAPSPQTAGQRVTTSYTYNGAGQPERIDRPGTRSDLTKYSLDGLVIETTGAAGEVPHVQTFEYDPSGNRTQAKRTVGGIAEYDAWTYTADNLVADYVTGKTDSSPGNKTSYEYDLVGNPVRVYAPAANACHPTNCPAGASRGTPTRYTYTLDNLVRTTTVPVASNGSSKRETTNSYDLGGRKIEQAVRMVDGTDSTFIGAKKVSAATTAVGSVDLYKPDNTTPNDIMLASIIINDSSPTSIVVPNGWNEIRNDVISGALRQLVYWKKVDTSDDGVTFYRWSLGGTTRRMTGGIQTFRGVNTADPIVDKASTISTATTSTVSAPPVNAMRGGMLVHFATVNGEGTIAPPPGMEESWETTAYNPADNRDVLAQSSWTGVTKDGQSTTLAASTNASGGRVGAVISLRPAAPGTPEAPPAGIALVGQRSKTSGDASSQSLSIDRPSGLQVGDLLVAQIASNDDDPDIVAPTATPAWTLLKTSTVTDALRQSVFVRVATATDVAANSFTFTLSSFRRVAGGLAAYRGVDTSNLSAIANDALASSTAGTAVATPTITAPANSELIQFSAVSAEGTISAPVEMQQQPLWHQAAPNSSNTRDVLTASFREGPVPTGGVTRTATSQYAGKRIGMLMALAPAAAAGPAAPNGSTSQRFSYYPNDRLESEFGRNTNEQIRHRYDAAGNPVEDKDLASNHKVTSDYYLDGLPRTVASGIGTTVDTTAYGYNGVGLPISRNETGTQAHATKYRYNDAGLIDQVTSSLETAGQWTWTYDAAGRPLEENAPNGYKVTKTWRADDTLATQRLVNNAQMVLADWTYHHDELYRQKSQDFTGRDANGVQASKNFNYTYWPTGELKTFNDGIATKNVTWDPDGNRTGFGNNVTATYNADDSVKSVTDSGTTTTFEYLPFGGVRRDERCNAYDGFDRLISTRPLGTVSGTPSCGDTSPTPIAQYNYDATDRQRSRTAADGKVTSFRYDGRSSSVAGEKRDTTIINYVLNPDGAAEAVNQTGTPGTEFLFDDGYGNLSTVAKNGSVACAVRYNPFGETISPQSGSPCSSGGTLTSGFYRGERRDENTGRYQLGSRTYDPKTSSFLTPDSYRAGGSAQNLSVGVDPLTRNSYSYVNGDPLNFVDPDGHVRTYACATNDNGQEYCPSPNAPGGAHLVGTAQRPSTPKTEKKQDEIFKLQKKIRKLDKNFKPPASYYDWDVETRLQWSKNLHGALDSCKRWAGACVSAEYFKTGGSDPELAQAFGRAYCIDRMCEGPIGRSAVIDVAAAFAAGPTLAAARGLLARAGGSAATEAGVGGIGALSKADDFGIWPYRTLKADLKGTGLQAHHLIEQRFAAVIAQQPGRMASIAVTKAEHQVFTNAWRRTIPYGAEGTGMATRMEIENAARQIYADYPHILKALGL